MDGLDFISDVIYHLKREYGVPGIIGRETTSVNTDTGAKSRVISLQDNIGGLIFLPFNWRKYFAQKEKGGVTNVGTQEILVDSKDIDFEPLHGDFIKAKGVTRDIKTVEKFEGRAYVLTIVAIDGMQNVRP